MNFVLQEHYNIEWYVEKENGDYVLTIIDTEIPAFCPVTMRQVMTYKYVIVNSSLTISYQYYTEGYWRQNEKS